MCFKRMNRILCALMVLFMLVLISATAVSAKEATINVQGTIHKFEEGDHYEMSASTKSTESAFGTLSLSGDLRANSTMGIYPKYTVKFLQHRQRRV